MSKYIKEKEIHPFPTSIKEMEKLGWDSVDVILFTGDAFVDHPSFGISIIARVLENNGYKVAVVPQPNWRDDLRDFKKFGTPRLFFGVTSGNMDSMVNHYTANKRLRSSDAFTPGNKSGYRPDYAVTVYSKILKSLYTQVPLIIGGIEASLRRLTHYDYWSDSLRPSILFESGADLLVYGMGEKAIVQIADRLNNKENIKAITQIQQTAFCTKKLDLLPNAKIIELASYEECLKSKKAFARNFVLIEKESNKAIQNYIIEKKGNSWVVVNPAFQTMTEEEIDKVYNLPFTRLPHPKYKDKEPIPAFEMIKDSITIHRGCFGGCSFCTISAHQGKFISSRSKKSVLREINKIAQSSKFKGHITDLGGPSANMYKVKGLIQNICDQCARASCIHPNICKNLKTDLSPLIELYAEARQTNGIKKITIGSGIRYDLILDARNNPISDSSLKYLAELIIHHVSGRLKVAPEHTSERILRLIRKPNFGMYIHLHNRFNEICKENGLNQQLIPYFISSLPDSKLEDMAELSTQLHKLNLHLEQIQDFTPTPMTLSSAMFYTGFDPYTLKKLYIPQSSREKKLQQQFFFQYDEKKRKELKSELAKIKRHDIIKQLGL